MSQKLVLSSLTEKFCTAVAAGSPSTGAQYGRRLYNFDLFLKQKYNITIDQFVLSYKDFNIYDVLSGYHSYLNQIHPALQKTTISARLRTAKTFLEYNDVPINETQFRLKVRTPKQTVNETYQALTKPLVNKIIIACQTPRLHTYTLTLAATGGRAVEILSILTKHINWEEGTVYLRKDWTKTKRARIVSLTEECLDQLKVWKQYRERERRIVGKNGKVVYSTKPLRPDDLFFSTGRIANPDEQSPNYMYHILSREFSTVLDRIGLGARNAESKRHEITLHSFRRFVYSTIEGLGQRDFANYFIGHANSTYWRKTPDEKLEVFRKVEPYLTYLDYSKLEAKGADVETKLSDSQQELKNMKQKMDEMERKQDEFLEQFSPKNMPQIISFYQKRAAEDATKEKAKGDK